MLGLRERCHNYYFYQIKLHRYDVVGSNPRHQRMNFPFDIWICCSFLIYSSRLNINKNTVSRNISPSTDRSYSSGLNGSDPEQMNDKG